MPLQEETFSLLGQMVTNEGDDLRSISDDRPLLLVFLRHFGCTFCREALADIAKKRKEIEATGTKIVLVHMADNQLAERYFNRYGLADISYITDKECKFYMAFGLAKGNFNQLFGLKNWIRGFEAGVLKGHLVGQQMGDGFQMPGVFLIFNGEIREQFIHKSASDRPDYYKMVQCCATNV